MPSDARTVALITLPVDLGGDRLEKFETELRSLLAQSVESVRLSCEGLDHITSIHVSVLWSAARMCKDRGVPLLLCNVPPGLRRVLQTLDLAEVIGDYGDSGTGAAHASEPREAPGGDIFSLVLTRPRFTESLVRFRQYLTEWGISNRLVFELHSVFYETVQNILSYGGLSDNDEVVVKCQFVCGLLTLTIVDQGTPFDPTAADVQTDLRAAAKEKRKRGLGIVMIRKLTDHIEYRRVGGQNVLTIEKRVR